MPSVGAGVSVAVGVCVGVRVWVLVGGAGVAVSCGAGVTPPQAAINMAVARATKLKRNSIFFISSASLGGDGGGAQEFGSGAGHGKIQLAALVFDAVAGKVEEQQIVGLAISKECFDFL